MYLILDLEYCLYVPDGWLGIPSPNMLTPIARNMYCVYGFNPVIVAEILSDLSVGAGMSVKDI